VSIERARRGNGWNVRYRDVDSRQRSRLFDLKKDAEVFEANLRRARQLGPLAVQQLTARGGPTLDQWIERRWGPEHAVTLAQSTRHRYVNVYKCHILAPLGDVPLGELGVVRVREWQAAMVKAGVKAGTIQKARTLLSSVMRHAAESGAMLSNPLSLVRAPRAGHRESVQPLTPTVVEAIRRGLLDASPREVPASLDGQRKRRRYELAAPGTPQSRQRDALIVSMLAYAGIRSGELRALRWADIGEGTIHVQRAVNPDGSIKGTKTGERRVVQLLAPLAQDLREYRLAVGRPPRSTLLLGDGDGDAWSKTTWQNWRNRRWAAACTAAGVESVPRPHDLRHSFVSLQLAAGRQPTWVAKQAGHSLAVLLSTYAHLIDEYAERERVDPVLEIANARKLMCAESALEQRQTLVHASLAY
jgi:integrase